MNTRALFADLYSHMEWADAAVWSAVLASETAQGDESTCARLHHIHLVQRAFLSIWRAEPVDRTAGDGLAPRDLAAWARSYYPLARAILTEVPDEALDRVVHVPWTKQVSERLGFEPAPTTLAETVVQVYTHTGHHRGQVISRLRELGSAPPLVDYIAWLWQRRPAARWP
ncbi:MAG: DinB family protein [Acidobacteriota bacterium]|nr:DinB family protein [Acidobacteriota bacterium]